MSPAPAATAARSSSPAPQRAGSAAPRPAWQPQQPRQPQQTQQPQRPQQLPRTRPPLRVVPQRHTPARAPFVLLVSVILAGGLVLVLLVNTWLAQGSFTVKRLQEQQTSVLNQSQAVAQQIAAQSAPGALAVRAAELGMVPAPNPVFKSKDGAVLGVAQAAVRPAPPPPPPAATPSASASASPGASASASPSARAAASAPAQGSHG